MKKINIKSSKKQNLIELLLKTDKRRYHCLYLASCYFTADAAKSIINKIRQRIHLSKVVVYIDRKTAISIGKDKLLDFCDGFDDLTVELYAVDASSLFHTKAYALISFDGDDVYCGSLIVGSANLTGNGLASRNGNIESILDTQDNSLLNEFITQMAKLKLLEIEELDEFKNANSFNFRYALIQEGKFIHKWTDNLDQYLSVRYYLNENGKAQAANETFTNIGFNMETATISKRYFNFNYDPPHLENAENLTRNYGIETYLGYWIPNAALESLFEKDQFEFFKNLLNEQLSLQITSIESQIQSDLLSLQNANVIQLTDSDPIELLKNKILDLQTNELKLKRIFSKYEIFSLPFDISQKDDIENLFEDMLLVIESRKKKNMAMKAFMNAISKSSLVVFRESIK